MKRIFPFLALGLFFLNSLKAEKIEGRIIFKADTMEVTFNIPVTLIGQAPNYEKLQQGVKYYDATGKKKELRPSQANEIQFTYESRLIRMLSRQNMLMKGGLYHYSSTLFLKLDEDGPLN